MNYLIDIWEQYFEKPNPRDGNKWFAYSIATVFHETARAMEPVPEVGKGKGKKYGEPCGPYNKVYYGRGHVQLTWEANYVKGQRFLKERYGLDVPLHREPELMLEHQSSALILYDGMIHGWFTGVGLPKYFNATVEDPVNARRIVNALDKADLIAGYYWKIKPSVVKMPEVEEPVADIPVITISSDRPVRIMLGGNVTVIQ